MSKKVTASICYYRCRWCWTVS